MPAATLAQLQSALATSGGGNAGNYLEPGAEFLLAVNETGPRLYDMGYWQDLVEEQVYPGANGYIALGRDVKAVLDANVNNLPQRVFAQFHDLSTLGKSPFLPNRYGLVDQGYHATELDFHTIEDVDPDDVTPVETLHLVAEDGTPVSDDDFDWRKITVIGESDEGVPVKGVLSGTTELTLEFTPGIVKVRSITGTSLPYPVELRTDPAEAPTRIATVPQGSDVVRYRRYKIGGAGQSTFVHVLVKKAWVPVACEEDIVILGSIPAWKHALLGKLAEDNADVERANYHWSVTRQMLEDEISASRGAAIPRFKFDLSNGCAPAIHSLQ